MKEGMEMPTRKVRHGSLEITVWAKSLGWAGRSMFLGREPTEDDIYMIYEAYKAGKNDVQKNIRSAIGVFD